ncbi:MAG: hypothetical protein CVU59_06865 [Deltaproteobacteria bacterium HGW-Deltaproteobacteria-17]|nr:MAG: hypothetical protein CVU59_06865 [Deltaproteobacteria bacterium HGW-Deltaproteobacteria-17]
MRSLFSLLFLTVLFSLAACDDAKKNSSWNDNNQNVNNVNNDAGTDGDVADADADPDADGGTEPDPVPDLAGTWAHVQLNGSLMNMPMVGVQSNQLISLVLVTMTQDGTTLAASEDVCDIKIESTTTMVTTIIPQAFVESMEPILKPVFLSWNGHAWVYNQPQSWAVQGVHLENIETDPMPTDQSDPRIFDQDLDSHPGLTVSVTGLLSGDIYVIQRGWNAMLSRELTVDHVFGYLTWENEQIVLDATNDILKDPIEQTVDPDETKSWFEFVRVSPGTTCQDLIDQKDTLFPRLAQ